MRSRKQPMSFDRAPIREVALTSSGPKTHTSVAETVGAQGRAPTSRRDALPACLGALVCGFGPLTPSY
jgi:hypothetical protein